MPACAHSDLAGGLGRQLLGARPVAMGHSGDPGGGWGGGRSGVPRLARGLSPTKGHATLPSGKVRSWAVHPRSFEDVFDGIARDTSYYPGDSGQSLTLPVSPVKYRAKPFAPEIENATLPRD